MDKFLVKTTHTVEPISKMKSQRKPLSPLQVIGTEKATPVTDPYSVHAQDKPQNAKSYFKKMTSENSTTVIYEDPVCQPIGVKSVYASTQTESLECNCACHVTKETAEAEEEADRLMVQEEIPEDYWKILAEQRRVALEEALQENKGLYEEIQRLRVDNEALTELASHAEYFAEVLKKAVNDDSGIVDDETTESDLSTAVDDSSEDYQSKGGKSE